MFGNSGFIGPNDGRQGIFPLVLKSSLTDGWFGWSRLVYILDGVGCMDIGGMVDVVDIVGLVGGDGLVDGNGLALRQMHLIQYFLHGF
jgi:hypothetical protein